MLCMARKGNRTKELENRLLRQLTIGITGVALGSVIAYFVASQSYNTRLYNLQDANRSLQETNKELQGMMFSASQAESTIEARIKEVRPLHLSNTEEFGRIFTVSYDNKEMLVPILYMQNYWNIPAGLKIREITAIKLGDEVIVRGYITDSYILPTDIYLKSKTN